MKGTKREIKSIFGALSVEEKEKSFNISWFCSIYHSSLIVNIYIRSNNEDEINNQER